MSTPILDDVLLRGGFLLHSLICENLTSYFLANLVGIENHEESRTLGHKGSSLSFSQRVDFLMDLKVLNQAEKSKFQTFMEIRNQLMHNLCAFTYVKCFGFLPEGKAAWILKQYPQPANLAQEIKLKNAAIALARDVKTLVFNINNALTAKKEKDKLAPSLRRRLDARNKGIEEVKNIIDELIAKKIGSKKLVTAKHFNNIGAEVSGVLDERIKTLWFQEIDKTRQMPEK